MSLEIGGMNKEDMVDGLSSSAPWPPTVTAGPRSPESGVRGGETQSLHADGVRSGPGLIQASRPLPSPPASPNRLPPSRYQ